MPKTKTQRIVFGILMSFFMAYGMEVYNIAIRMGYNLTVGQGFRPSLIRCFSKH